MKWDYDRREAEFGTFKNKWEKSEGGEAKKRKAIDLPVRHPLRPKELDMIVPPGKEGGKLSTFLYGPNLRKPQLQTHLLTPLPIARKPEHITFTIYDSATDKRKHMTFEGCLVKDPELDLQDTTPYVSYTLKIFPTFAEFQRIAENVENRTCEFDCRAAQPELFEPKADDEDEADGQGDMVGGGASEPGAADDDDDDDED